MENIPYKRRDFLAQTAKAGASLWFLKTVPGNLTASTITVAQIIERIIAEVPGGPLKETIDTLKSGAGDQVVTGIVTTMFCTIPVIEEAVRLKANFIIAHEPTFYNHTDNPVWVENNSTERSKMALLTKYQIVVWRFHDYWHRMKPDGILHGVLLKTDWLKYNVSEENVFQIPPAPLEQILQHLKKSLQIPHVRFIGRLTDTCSKIALIPGAAGGQRQVSTLISSQADLLIVGEASEWETPEYVRDSRALGKKISMIVLGHAYSEEPGMEWLASWLKPKLQDLPISHVPSLEPFSWA